MTTKQSDSYLDVSGEAKADAIMEEEGHGEEDGHRGEDGQGEKEEEEEEVNKEKSQSQVPRDSSTVNS